MPRRCTVCTHPEAGTINRALVAGESSRAIAARYGSLSRSAIQRHGDNHVPEQLARAREAEEVAHADDLLEQVRNLQIRTLAILETAERSQQHRTALTAVREARSNLELLAKLLGELDERPTVNVLLSPEWLKLRAMIVEALEPFSEARESVLMAIEGVG